MLIVHTCAINTSKKYYRNFCTSYILITSLSCTSLNTPSFFFFWDKFINDLYHRRLETITSNNHLTHFRKYLEQDEKISIFIIFIILFYHVKGNLHNYKTKVKSSRFNFITEIGLLSHWNFNLSIYIINTIIYFNIDNIIYFSFEMTKKYLYFFHTLL